VLCRRGRFRMAHQTEGNGPKKSPVGINDGHVSLDCITPFLDSGLAPTNPSCILPHHVSAHRGTPNRRPQLTSSLCRTLPRHPLGMMSLGLHDQSSLGSTKYNFLDALVAGALTISWDLHWVRHFRPAGVYGKTMTLPRQSQSAHGYPRLIEQCSRS
jgi:hypothetical protein